MFNICCTLPFVHIMMCMETTFVAGYVNALNVLNNILLGVPPFTSSPDRNLLSLQALYTLSLG